MARPPKQTRHDDEALLIAVLTGFPDRVARRRTGNQVLLSTGISAEVAGEPPPYEFMLAIEVEVRQENPLPLIRMTARVEPEWLLDLFPDRIEERSSVVWNLITERVERVSAVLYDKLVIEESRGAASETEAADLLARKALEVGIDRFVEKATLEHLLARLTFAGFEPPDIPQALRELCLGLQSFGDLKDASRHLMPLLEEKVNTRLLNEIAPLSIRLRNGRQTKVHYEPGRPPWISSRLQDFFGMTETPRIGPDKTPLVIHLLAPNHRAVQTTTDRRKSPLSLRPALGAWRADGAHDGGTAGLLCDGERWRILSGLRATPLSLRHPGQCSSTADRAGPARSLLWSLRSNPLLHHILSNLLSCPLCRFTLPAQRAGDALVVPCRSHTVSSGCTLINLLILMHDPVPALLGLLAVLCGDPVRRFFFSTPQIAMQNVADQPLI
jgi:hypothetical protein